ncbi:TadE/TadG family type IV pilus assembly protein [Streptomyces stramineus]
MEFTGLLPLILVVLAVVWQCVLIGYTYSLAGNAADKGARAGAVGGDCVAAARADVPGAWGSEGIGCGEEGGVYRARVSLAVPLLLPGAVDWPWAVEGSAGSARED